MSADKSSSSYSSKPLEAPTSAKHNDDPYSLSSIDQRIERLKSHLSPAPYLLDLPSDRPYNAPQQQANDWRLTWRRNHPFHPKEKALQYMSYHHLEWEDSLLRPVGNWDDGKGRIMEEDAPKAGGLHSGPGTPLLAASTSKKKTTLKDYIGRKTTSKQESSNTPSHSQESNGDVQTKDTADEKMGGLKNNTEKSDRPITKPKEHAQLDDQHEKPQTSQITGKKRPLDSSEDAHPHERSTPKQDAPRPEKKPRLGSPIQEVPSKPLLKPDRSDLPLVSTTPPPTSNGKLPKLISPTLPAALESELRKLPSLTNGTLAHKKTDSIASVSSEGKRSKSAKLQEKPAASPKPKAATPLLTNGVKDTSKATPSPSLKADTISGKNHKPSDSDVSQKSAHLNGLKSGSLHERKEAKPEKRERRIIKLKYGRRNKQAVRRILGMTAQPKKAIDDAPSRKSKEEVVRGQKEKPPRLHESAVKSPLSRLEKRPRPADQDESSSQPPKRQRAPPSSLNLDNKPRTPIPTPFKSPAFSKSQFSTPKKDLKSVAMRRVDSGDGDARTPSGARAGTPTAPNSVEKSGLAKTSPPNTSGSLDSRQEQKRQWRLEAQKYEQLARSLKHQADKHLKTKEGPSAKVSEEDAKLGAVAAIETILCYMLSFFATDQANQISTGKHASDANAWLSIIPYWYFVRERVEAFTDLHGLCMQIGALCRETICAFDMEKLAQDPLPKTTGDGISPPSDAGHLTPNSAKAAQYHREYVDFKARMVSNFHKARALWIDGTRDLSLQNIEEGYPTTWAMQQSDTSTKGKEKFVPGKYEGQFYLPLSGTSTPIEAARFGCALLGEWCKKEGIQWDNKIGL